MDRDADDIIDGLVSEQKKGNTRAFVAGFDRAYGIPATKLIIQREDDPASDLLLRMMAAKGVLPASVSSEVLNDGIVPQLPIGTATVIDAADT